MVALVAPNGVEVNVPQEQVDRLLGLGYSRAEAKRKTEPKAAPRKRAAKPKE